MSTPISRYRRPRDLDPEVKQKIQDMFPVNVRIDWQNENINVYSGWNSHTELPFEIVGKMIGLFGYHAVTVRQPKKKSKLK